MLPKSFNATEAQARWMPRWEAAGSFAADPQSAKLPYAIMMPPPNVTGTLHMGHALNHSLQDILIRLARMQGKDALWQPGMDHAGIAVQAIVERQLDAEGLRRRDVGREAFLERSWAWKAESGGTITHQLRQLGTSPDWSRERFSLDEGLSRAVREVFVKLYRDGLLYKAKRLVNWDPQLRTAISDLEVQNQEVPGQMWHFKYPLVDGLSYEFVQRDAEGRVLHREQRDYISIATTRPETMLGDGAVAVHPEDTRYASLIGRFCEIPVGPKALRRSIPIIADSYPDPNFGSGAVKITGAHDFNDYDVAQRNGLPLFNLMDERAALRQDGLSYEDSAKLATRALQGEAIEDIDAINLVPEALRGLDRFEARAALVEAITNEGLAVMVESDAGPIPLVEQKPIMQPFGERSGAVIEPLLTDQWFVDAPTLAKRAIAAVRDGETRFVPQSWEKTYFQWLEHIQPWCISRQLWWGHRIPAWVSPEGRIFVAHSEAEAQAQAEAHYGEPVSLSQDEDVLDTWFSSALWPFSTLGWPEQTPELARYYPGDVLLTAFDIIFFWVARMMMLGIYVMDQVPFREVYIHALVRDAKGQKMSKSKGNIIDPLEMIEAYGADALRFSYALAAAPGRDIPMSSERVETARNFVTKLWNAARFAEMNAAAAPADFDPASLRLPLNRWAVTKLTQALSELNANLERYHFHEAAATLYHFTWHRFCDWYLELAKVVLQGDDAAAIAETRATLAFVLKQTVHMLHPFLPFVTETLWESYVAAANGNAADEPRWLIQRAWPELPEALRDSQAEADLDWLILAISTLRTARAELNIPAAAQLEATVQQANAESLRRLAAFSPMLMRLARLKSLSVNESGDAVLSGTAQVVVAEATFRLPLADHIDVAAETARLEKEIAKREAAIAKLDARLDDPAFCARAPEAVVAKQREARASEQQALTGLQRARERLLETQV